MRVKVGVVDKAAGDSMAALGTTIPLGPAVSGERLEFSHRRAFAFIDARMVGPRPRGWHELGPVFAVAPSGIAHVLRACLEIRRLRAGERFSCPARRRSPPISCDIGKIADAAGRGKIRRVDPTGVSKQALRCLAVS